MSKAFTLNISLCLILLWGASAFAGSPFHVPAYVSNVPHDHFAGVSVLCDSIAEARSAAVSDVVKQILSAMNVRYRHQYDDRIYGDPQNRIDREIDDHLTKISHGIVLGVEQRIVKSALARDNLGKYICFILVRFPDNEIRKMRSLTRGAKIVASLITRAVNQAVIEISELNGVLVTFSSAVITVKKRNRFAKAITLFFWRVPSKSERQIRMAISPVKIMAGSKKLSIPLSPTRNDLYDLFLGAKAETIITLHGSDELGRPVVVNTEM